MNFRIYHQLGYRYVWNFDSLLEDRCGDGVIIAPRFMDPDYVENLDVSLKKNSIFDPQFFLPDTPKGKLDKYDFFPHVASDGFDTEDYPEQFASECAERCIAFQLTNQFNRLVIPARYLKGVPSDFINQQQRLFVGPFLVIAQYPVESISLVVIEAFVPMTIM